MILRVCIVIVIIVLLMLLYAEFKPLQKPKKVAKVYYMERKVERGPNVITIHKPKLASVIKYDRRKTVKEE